MDREQAFYKISDYEWNLDPDCDIIVVGKGMFGDKRNYIVSLVATDSELAEATHEALDAFQSIKDETWAINGHVDQLEDEINSVFGHPYEAFDITEPDEWSNWLYTQVDIAHEWLRDELDTAMSNCKSASAESSYWEDKYYCACSENDELRTKIEEMEEETSDLKQRVYDLEQELKEAQDEARDSPAT